MSPVGTTYTSPVLRVYTSNMRAVSTQQQLECCVLTARILFDRILPRVKTLGLDIPPLQGL